MKWIVTIVLLAATTCPAATWIKYADNADTVYEYTPDLITNHDNRGKVLVVWTRQRDAVTITNKTKYEVHCASRSARLTVQVRFAGADVVYQLTDPGAKWNYATPDSVEMALIDATCPYYR